MLRSDWIEKQSLHSSLPSALVISLDFELHWGVSERVSTQNHTYLKSLYGTHDVVRRILTLLSDKRVKATWATVGKLFAHSKLDLESFKPNKIPAYARNQINTYLINIGNTEQDDPIHFASSLIQDIKRTPGQEIGTHTFSHYYCDEPGQNIDDFKADLEAAKAIAARDKVVLDSLVFPRNQVIPDYLSALEDAGIRNYRGNPPGGLQHIQVSGIRRFIFRATRFADSFINLTGHNTVPWTDIVDGELNNIRAGHFLRPYSKKLQLLEPLRVRRVKSGMRAAAQRGEIYHLWWHPHNFGAEPNKNLAALASILEEFKRLQQQYGMQSLTMSEVAQFARTHSTES